MKSIFDERKFEMAVKEIMTKNVITVTKTTSADICAKLMIENKIGSVVVLDEKGKTVGIITKENLIRHVLAKDADPKNVIAGKIMSSPLISASPNLSIIQAMQSMFKDGIRHLVVTGSDGKLQGICTDTDIFKVVPQLILLEQEYLRFMSEDQESELKEDFAGYCDDCKEYSDELIFVKGLYMCPNCAPEEMQESSVEG
ncbi:MAG: CBS domain-containing protein [Asgard group archaeon]|nr:CBS domain-containing protein [Asgard group archaeon]